MTPNEPKKVSVAFAALDPYIETNIISPKETSTRLKGKSLLQWGDGNGYPDYILSLYQNVVTLHTVVDGLTDYICGDRVDVPSLPRPNPKMTWQQFWRKLAFSRALYKGASFQVIRDGAGSPREFWPVDMRFIRTDKEASVWYYSEYFGKGYTRSGNMLEYPTYMKESNAPTSIVPIWDSVDGVYPSPWIAAAVPNCETERSVDEYHLNAINNGFAASYFVNFNNGVPDDKIKEEIEKDFTEKFAGGKNAGRIGFSWNPNIQARTTFESIKQEDFGDRYSALSKNTRQQIFTAYRANPNLFGIPTESLGFSQEEYDSAFRLFNRTMVMPQQRILREALESVLGEGAVTVVPFSMETVSSNE